MLKRFFIITYILFLTSCALQPDADFEAIDNRSAAAEINLKLALAYLNRQETALAKEKLLVAQKQDHDNPLVWYVTGYFLEKTDTANAAQQAYLHAIKLSPHNGAAHNDYGAFLCRQKRYDEAVRQFLLATKDPDYLYVNAAYHNASLCAAKN
jgi:type IV pilus assembly protein PilF